MVLSLLLFFTFFFAPETPKDNVPKSIYDFKVEALEGGVIDFSKFKGKKILIVNTASECGYTPQYEDLQALHKKYKNKLVIVGFPSNDFGKQEPGNAKEIAAFCKKNYGVTFPMAAKVVVTGNNMTPIYQWLTQKQYNNYDNTTVKWNFQKYLLNEKGQLIKMFPSKVKPSDIELVSAIEK